MQARCRRDAGEMQARYGGDMREHLQRAHRFHRLGDAPLEQVVRQVEHRQLLQPAEGRRDGADQPVVLKLEHVQRGAQAERVGYGGADGVAAQLQLAQVAQLAERVGQPVDDRVVRADEGAEVVQRAWLGLGLGLEG